MRARSPASCSWAATTASTTRSPGWRASCSLARDAVAGNVPVLGHCFGGQLLARALGADGASQPVAEHRLEQPAHHAGGTADLRAGPQVQAFNWHYESFAIPAGATRTLYGEHCLNKGFVFGPHLAFQGHFEVTEAIVKAWCLAHDEELAYAGGPAVQSGAADPDLPARTGRGRPRRGARGLFELAGADEPARTDSLPDRVGALRASSARPVRFPQPQGKHHEVSFGIVTSFAVARRRRAPSLRRRPHRRAGLAPEPMVPLTANINVTTKYKFRGQDQGEVTLDSSGKTDTKWITPGRPGRLRLVGLWRLLRRQLELERRFHERRTRDGFLRRLQGRDHQGLRLRRRHPAVLLPAEEFERSTSTPPSCMRRSAGPSSPSSTRTPSPTTTSASARPSRCSVPRPSPRARTPATSS